jgi:hypothetical protein
MKMVESRSVKGSLGLDLKSIYLIVIVVGAVTGGNLWLHRDDLPLGYVRYSNFGFSFVYPQLFDTYSWGYPDPASGPSDFGGGVQAKKYWEGVWQNVIIMWSTEASTPDLEAKLDEFYVALDSWGCKIDVKDQLLASEKDGHEMLYQTYIFWEDTFRPGGAQFIAASGVWYEPWPSLHANRVYVLTYIAFPELTTQQQVLERFQWYLDSFVPSPDSTHH